MQRSFLLPSQHLNMVIDDRCMMRLQKLLKVLLGVTCIEIDVKGGHNSSYRFGGKYHVVLKRRHKTSKRNAMVSNKRASALVKLRGNRDDADYAMNMALMQSRRKVYQ